MEHQSATKKGKTFISSFFKKIDRETSESSSHTTPTMQHQSSESLQILSVQIPSISSPSKDNNSFSSYIERDPGKRKLICEYHVNARDEVRRSYLKKGPYQPDLLEYPGTKFGRQNRRFNKNGFRNFIGWSIHLQRKSQDILTVVTFVSTTKTILQELREYGCDEFINEVKVLCSRNEIDVPDLDCLYKIGRSRQQITVEHRYHFDVFNAAIDFILMELNTRFNESSVELLSLSSSLDPKNSFDSFNSNDICKLPTKFYPKDFTDQEIVALEYELIHYKLDVMQNLKVSTLVELCQLLTDSGRSKVYVMLTRLINLVLTLPVSTATTERAFSAMKHVKTTLRNKMEYDFLADCLTLYIERDLAKDINVNSIINEFYVSKSRRAQLC